MIIETLKLKNFRNYETVEMTFTKGLNFICGLNGAGKTNIVEAIHYLSLARSFRSQNSNDLIRYGESFGAIEANIKRDTQSHNVRIVISEDKRSISINQKEIKKISELSEIVNVIVFEPRDVGIFQAIPKIRRNYMDVSIAKNSRIYLQVMSDYEKLLAERNEILKSNQVNREHLDIVTQQMIELSYEIVTHRAKFIKDLEPTINKVIKNISEKQRVIALTYNSFVEANSKAQFLESAKNAFAKALENDLKRRVTTIGVHREDFSTALNNKNLAAFGSQGEKRISALALKVAPYFLVGDKENRPIVVLDDVLSELDEEHAERLLKFFEKFEQVFITGTKIEITNASTYEVLDRNVRRISYGR